VRPADRCAVRGTVDDTLGESSTRTLLLTVGWEHLEAPLVRRAEGIANADPPQIEEVGARRDGTSTGRQTRAKTSASDELSIFIAQMLGPAEWKAEVLGLHAKLVVEQLLCADDFGNGVGPGNGAEIRVGRCVWSELEAERVEGAHVVP